jgi:predicted NAD/FAD-dependent oxidoreductase
VEIDTISNQEFDGIVIATNPKQAHRLLTTAFMATANADDSHASEELLANMQFSYEPISTCYLQYPETVKLDRPFYALADDPQQGRWAQFVFDRGQLNANQAGLMAVVISASTEAISQPTSQIITDVCQQLAQQLQIPALATPTWTQVITEKRATFACTPDLKRPVNQTAISGIALAGDFTASDYPATLESAVRSGIKAAELWPST